MSENESMFLSASSKLRIDSTDF